MALEFTKLQFDNGKYNYSILKTIEISGRNKAYESIEKTFENLYSFKAGFYSIIKHIYI